MREPSCPHVCRVERPEWTSSTSGVSYCPITSTHGYAMHRRALPLVQAYGMHMASGWLPFSQSEGRKSAGIDEMLPNTFRHVHYLLPGRFYQPGHGGLSRQRALEAGWNELCVKPSIADRGVGGVVDSAAVRAAAAAPQRPPATLSRPSCLAMARGCSFLARSSLPIPSCGHPTRSNSYYRTTAKTT